MVLVFRFLIVRIVFRERGLAVGLGAGVKFKVLGACHGHYGHFGCFSNSIFQLGGHRMEPLCLKPVLSTFVGNYGQTCHPDLTCEILFHC